MKNSTNGKKKDKENTSLTEKGEKTSKKGIKVPKGEKTSKKGIKVPESFN